METAEECRQRGNELLQRGDFADAAQQYDQGLVALLPCQDEKVPKLRAALHLNASLAHLRRGNLGSAIDHASGALAADASASSSSVKALYRRGLARRRLAEHQNEQQNLQLAQEDLEKALQLDPSNSEVRQLLQQLRDQLRQERTATRQAQRQTAGFRKIFAGPALYDTEKPKPILREMKGKEKEVLVSTESLCFDYDDPVLQGVDLELRAGRCMGLVGLNASGKTTLARLLRGQLRPKAGTIRFLGDTTVEARSGMKTMALGGAVAIFVALLAVMIPRFPKWRAEAVVNSHLPMVGVGVTVALLLLLLLALWRRFSGGSKPQVLVLHLSSETSDKDVLKASRSIEAVIGDELPKWMSLEQRQKQVIKMLQAGGFQMYNQETGEPIGNPMEYIRDGLRFGKLSGGQQHLIYILRYFAKCLTQLSSCAVLLACDEVLGGLDSIRQPRVLRMLKQLVERNVGMLYISTELHQLHVMADDLAFLHDGIICESGGAAEVLQAPKHGATKDYVAQWRQLPGGHTLGGKLAESYAKLEKDEGIENGWCELQG